MRMLSITRDARGLATLKLDRPEARNALSGELVTRLTDALAELAGDRSVRIVALTGAGSVFCAGADIGEMRAAGAAMSIPSWRTISTSAPPRSSCARRRRNLANGRGISTATRSARIRRKTWSSRITAAC